MQNPLSISADQAFACNRAGVIGVDEVGRGPLAGPVMAAAAYLNPYDETLIKFIHALGLDDSKRLSAKKRQIIFQALKTKLPYALGCASVNEIDHINILQASHLAMRRAILRLYDDLMKQGYDNDFIILIDGKFIPKNLPHKAHAIIKGDQTHLCIAAASIIAKEMRDHLMQKLACRYPAYLWHKNSGYGTKAHLTALEENGITAHHRQSFAPIKSFSKLQ